MAKGKKKLAKLTTRGFGAKNLDLELCLAEEHFMEGDWAAACRILLPLSQQYPHNKRVWECLSDASFESGDMRLYQKACMGLLAVDPNDSNETYGLGGAYFHNQHPMLALRTFRRALELNPNHEFAPIARESVEKLEPIVQGLLEELGLNNAEGLEIATLHELGQAYLEQGDYAVARKTEEEVLERHPRFLSAHNNLSLVSWLEKDAEGAIAIAQAVLETEPNNIHALSNLIQFQVRLGNADAARPYGEQLKASQSDAWEGWTKKIEGLSYLADDAGVVEVFAQALDEKRQDSPTNAMFYHWAAVALARTGDKKRAITQWKKAISLDPSFRLAQENLSDIQKSVGQQHGAWPFSWEHWLIPKSFEELQQMLKTNLKSGKSGKLESVFKAFLAHHPEVLTMLPRVLERGGPQGQEFVLSTTEQLKTPELLSIVADFALSQNGSDQMRNRAADLAVKAKLLPQDKILLWIDGEWRKLMLMSYEFHSETTTQHSRQVEQCLEKALHLLQTGGNSQAKDAEALLIQALEVEPESPDLLNNLALAYVNQNREKEAYSLVRDIANRFPDYVFAHTTAAKICIDEGDFVTAEALLRPFLSRERFHFLEFSDFCDAYIELLMAQKQRDVARSWLDIWEQADPNSPRLDYWKQRLSKGILQFPKLWR